MDRPVVEGCLRRLSWLISRWDYGNMRRWQKGVVEEETEEGRQTEKAVEEAIRQEETVPSSNLFTLYLNITVTPLEAPIAAAP